MPLATHRSAPTDVTGTGEEGGRPASSTTSIGTWRRTIERGLRGIALGVILWSFAVFASAGNSPQHTVSQRDLPRTLVTWTAGPAPQAVRLELSAVPDAATRDWLGAIATGGTHVSWVWSGAVPAAEALTVRAMADPAGRVRIAVAAPSGARLTVADNLGSLDSMTAGAGGASVERAPPIGLTAATAGTTVARAAVGDSLLLRHVLVLGRVGWESKFLVRGLEERGWQVDVHLMVTPRAAVTQDPMPSLDTGRVAAVLAVGEASGVSPTALERYVREGGGLVLLDGAERNLTALAVADSGVVAPPATAPLGHDASVPPASVVLRPMTHLRPGAMSVERRAGQIAVAVRAIAAGRIEQVAYRDTWRWRMMGGDSGVVDHRRWWATRVSDVAYAPAVPVLQPVDADPSPLTSWIDRMGPPNAASPRGGPRLGQPSLAWLFAVLVTVLAAEWWSRRLRGQP